MLHHMGQVVTVETCLYFEKMMQDLFLPVFTKQQLYGHVHAPFRVLHPVDLAEAAGSDLLETVQTVIADHIRRKAVVATVHLTSIYSTPALSILLNSLEFRRVTP